MSIALRENLKALYRYGLWSELSNLFRIINEVLLLLLWFVTLAEGRISWWEGFGILGVIFGGSYLLSRFLHTLKWKISVQRVLFTLWIVLVIILSASLLLFSKIEMSLSQFIPQLFAEELSPETTFSFWVLLFSLLSLLRGVQLARYPVSARDTTAHLRLSIILFAAYAILFGRFHLGIFLPTFFVFMLLSLASLSLARIADLSDSFGSRLPWFNMQWAGGIAAAAMGVVLLGMLSSVIINLDVAEFLGKGLTVLLQLVTGALVVVTSPILLAIIAVIQFLFKLISPNLENIMDPNELKLGGDLLQDLQNQITEVTRTDPRLFIMIGVLLLFVVAAVVQLRWNPWKRDVRGEDGSSDIDSIFRSKNPLKNIFPARGRKKRRASAQSLIAAARIRYTYAQLMDLCERLEKPRPRSLTPLEFLPRMNSLFPLNTGGLELITNAYIKVRYGELPETSKDIEEVLEAWNRVSQFGKELLDERLKSLRRTMR